jgi:hypothetical protein
MIAEVELNEYLDEIRERVCSICVERPPGGPPCAPLGKECGIEMHLPQLVESVRGVRSALIEPYLDHNRTEICRHCPRLHSEICPCPMDYLAVPLVEAIEAVEERLGRGKDTALPAALPPADAPDITDIRRAFEEAEGMWTGCDWPTRFGKSGLDLNGIPADYAGAVAQAGDTPEAQDWTAAAAWLAWLEKLAARAESHAARALGAAGAGKWPEAVTHARWARALEFACGRPIRRAGPLTWGAFCTAVEMAAGANGWPPPRE